TGHDERDRDECGPHRPHSLWVARGCAHGRAFCKMQERGRELQGPPARAPRRLLNFLARGAGPLAAIATQRGNTMRNNLQDSERWDDEPTAPFEWLRTARVLVAEDDDALREMITTRLRGDGCYVIQAKNGDEALDLITSIDSGHAEVRQLDLVVIDVRMPGMSGLDVVRVLRAWQWGTPVLFVTAYPDDRFLSQAGELGASVLAKPFVLSRLSRVASDTLAKRWS